MHITQTKLTIFRKDKQPINDEEVDKISSQLDSLSFHLQAVDSNDPSEFLHYSHDSNFFTVTQSAIEINLSRLLTGTTFNSVKQKLGLVLKSLQERLESTYSYQIRLI